MKIANYYIYGHFRKDTQEIFYVGFGTDYYGTFRRANQVNLSKRNFIWRKIYLKCKNQIDIKILFQFDNIEEAYKKEIELISKYGRLIDKKGGCLSNLSFGGEIKCGPKKKAIQYDQNGKPLKIWESGFAAAKKFGVSYPAIFQAISKHNCCKGYQWRWYDETTKSLNYIPKVNYSKMKQIHQYDLKGNYKMSYKNMAVASKITSIDRASINNCAIGNRRSAGGFIWSFTNTAKNKYNRLIIKCDKNNNKISEYNTLAEIVKEMNLVSSTAIRNCFSGKQKQAYGFIWKEIKK